MLDPERIYRYAQDGDWAEGLALVHQHPEAVMRDAVARQAVATLEDAFFTALNGSVDETSTANALEKWLLLHSGGFHRLPEARFERVVQRLVEWHRSRNEAQAAQQVARFAPDLAACEAVLKGGRAGDEDEMDRVVRRQLEHDQPERIRLTVNDPASEVDHRVSLFKSAQEEAFFRAARAAFPMYTPYPNVALSSLIDYEAIRDQLSADERTFFFKGIVDCVIFDQHEQYRPLYFFELDSAHHDAPERRANDCRKDRILSCAGHRLYRIRPRGAGVTQADFERLLRSVVRRSSVSLTE